MRRFVDIAAGHEPCEGELVLPFELRQRSRFRAALAGDGGEAGVILPRGRVLRGGDRLLDEHGVAAVVVAAPEPLSVARSGDPVLLARACYHLGNRHVALAIGDGVIRWQHDHVLDDLVRGLGLEVGFEEAPFEPEAGAYGGGHAHGHRHDDDGSGA